MPKFSKVACRLMPSHGFSSLQTGRRVGSARAALHCCLSASSQNPTTTSEMRADCAQPTDGETEAQGGATQAGTQIPVSLAPPSTQVSIPERDDGVGKGQCPREPHFLEPALCRAGLDVGCVALGLCPGHSACWGSTSSGWAPAGEAGRGIPERPDSWGAPSRRSAVQAWVCLRTQASVSQKLLFTLRGARGWLRVAHPSPAPGLLWGHLPNTKTLTGQSGGGLCLRPPHPCRGPPPDLFHEAPKPRPASGVTHPASRRAPLPGQRR